MTGQQARSEWKLVTPDLATTWLEGNTHNRRVRDAAVNRYAADMRAGRWKQTHQGIAFDHDGVLIDGQHRLFAVIEAEVDVLMLVTYGLPLESQRAVDDGITRTIVDVMRVSDEHMGGMTTLHAAVGRRMFQGFSRSDGVRSISRQELGEFLRRHWDAISFSVAQFPGSRRVRGVTSAAPMAALARAFYHETRADLVHFAGVLIDGLSTDERDFPAIKLRNHLLTRQSTSGTQASIDCYAKAQRAIHSFCNGIRVGRNLVPVTEDLYPLPAVKK